MSGSFSAATDVHAPQVVTGALGPPKNGNQRTVPVLPQLRPLLQGHIAQESLVASAPRAVGLFPAPAAASSATTSS